TFTHPAFADHRPVGFTAGHEAVVAVPLFGAIVVQAPYRGGAGRAGAIRGQQRLEGDAFVSPTVIFFLQQRALFDAASVEVRVDQLGVKAADGYGRCRRRVVGVPDVEAEVDDF